jgi:hypothetical protein
MTVGQDAVYACVSKVKLPRTPSATMEELGDQMQSRLLLNLYGYHLNRLYP